jgi:hypothetical protein
MTDIVERLNEVAQRNPDSDVDGTIASVCTDAIAEIMRLRTIVEQLQGVAGIATAGGQSFADIKQEIRK